MNGSPPRSGAPAGARPGPQRGGPGPSPIQKTLAAIARGQQAANAYERPDLARRLGATAKRVADPAFHLLVVGEFKQGKSSLVNALVGRQICPVDDDIATAVPTIVRSAEQARATAIYAGEGTDGEVASSTREPIDIDAIADFVTERGAQTGRPIQSVEIELPSRLLRGGLVVVDTPGVGGLGSAHGAVTVAALPMAEALLFVTDASQEFTAPELEFLQTARKLCPNVVCVLTKIDFYPGWQRIRDLDAAHLERLGIDAPIIATSTALHAQAMATRNGDLLAESGVSTLTTHIRNNILGRAVELSVGVAVNDLRGAVDQLVEHFEVQKRVLDDPDTAKAKIRELEAARTRADELKSRSARWQQTLNDGIGDLNTEVDHDLRSRFRKINQESDEALDDADPVDIWAEFERWLHHRASVDVIQNYELLQTSASQLADQVADHFEADGDRSGLDLNVLDPMVSLSKAPVASGLDLAHMSIGQQALTGLRGGYGGSLMFGALGSMAGVALGPVGIGIGILMGRKQLRDEKERQLGQRRAQARAAQRKYMDEVSFLASKDSRDALRLVQRQLRDFFGDRAQEQGTSISATLAAIQSAVQADQAERGRTMAMVTSELGKLNTLRQQIDQLAASAAASSTASGGGRS